MAASAGPGVADLHAALRRGDLRPVYLLHGEEDFLMQEALDALIAAGLAGAERNFNLDILDCADEDAREITAKAAAFPLLGERRVVVARNVDRYHTREKMLEILSAYVRQPSPTTVFVLLCQKPDFRKNPYKLIASQGSAYAAQPLWPDRIPGWIAARIRDRGKTVDEEAANLLAAHAGSALRLVSAEIEKILTYVGDRDTVTVDDVAALVGVSREYTVFELIHAVARRDLRRSMAILEHMLAEGQSGPFIVSMLTGQFSTVWKALQIQRENGRGRVTPKDLAARLAMRPIAAQDCVHFLERFSPQQIEGAFDVLVETDELLKSSSLDDRGILESMLVRLIGMGPVTQDHAA